MTALIINETPMRTIIPDQNANHIAHAFVACGNWHSDYNRGVLHIHDSEKAASPDLEEPSEE